MSDQMVKSSSAVPTKAIIPLTADLAAQLTSLLAPGDMLKVISFACTRTAPGEPMQNFLTVQVSTSANSPTSQEMNEWPFSKELMEMPPGQLMAWIDEPMFPRLNRLIRRLTGRG